jgi:mono/diheme cytochrome c family protein
MIANLITLLVLIVLCILFAWLTKRAWGSKHRILKWPALVLAGLLTLIIGLIVVLGAKGLYQLYAPYTPAAAQITVPGTPEQIARGEHIASVLCVGCHSQNGQLPLSGGNNLSNDAGLSLGDIYPPNITPGGKIKDLSDNDIWRILRTGVEPGGRLTFMTAVDTRHLSDEDALAVIAYLRSAPAVQAQRPAATFSFLMTLFTGAGLVNLDVPSTIQPVSAPPKAVTKEYGEYVVNFMDCRSCHGPTLSGDAPPPAPPGAANLTVVMPQWSKDDFFTAIRTGVDKTGHQIQPPMPWKTIRELDDAELGAVYEYLHSLTPILKKQ